MAGPVPYPGSVRTHTYSLISTLALTLSYAPCCELASLSTLGHLPFSPCGPSLSDADSCSLLSGMQSHWGPCF